MTDITIVENETTVTVTPGATAVVTVEQSADVDVVTIGIPGPQGPSGNAAATYSHAQAVAATVWTVTHNLGYRPNVAIFDEFGGLLFASITHIDENSLEITHGSAFAGSAYCS